MSKTSTTLAFASLVTVLLSTVVIGTASAKVFSNSGNIIKSDQNCFHTDSCTLTSSNVINQQPASTTPSPSPSPAPTRLTLMLKDTSPPSPACVGLPSQPPCIDCGDTFQLTSMLSEAYSPGNGIDGAAGTITFTGTALTGLPGDSVPGLLSPVVGSAGGNYLAFFETPNIPEFGTFTIQAHYAGNAEFMPADSQTQSFFLPAGGNCVGA
jgi:hypothetical protein